VDLAECFAKDGYNAITATPITADLGAIGGSQRLADAIKIGRR
jgi:hypothetical protein